MKMHVFLCMCLVHVCLCVQTLHVGQFSVSEVTNLFFIVLFTIEMIIKMYALGFQVSIHAFSF